MAGMRLCPPPLCQRSRGEGESMARPRVIYEAKPGSPLDVDRDLYGRLARETARRTLVERFVVPKRSGRAWPVRAGQLFRIVAVEGPQVADLNVWSLANPRERFWASRTRQLHRSHLTTFDRLWSCLPYLRPMLTITGDTLRYGRDEDGAGCAPPQPSDYRGAHGLLTSKGASAAPSEPPPGFGCAGGAGARTPSGDPAEGRR